VCGDIDETIQLLGSDTRFFHHKRGLVAGRNCWNGHEWSVSLVLTRVADVDFADDVALLELLETISCQYGGCESVGVE